MKTFFKSLFAVFFGSAGIVVVIVVLAGIGLGLQYVFSPWRMDIDREVQTHSRQFVESKQTLLIKLVTDYTEAKVEGHDEHAAAILTRIRAETALLPDSEIPPPVRPYLEESE